MNPYIQEANQQFVSVYNRYPIKITMFFLILLFRQRLWGVVFRWEQSERADVQLAFLVLVITELPMAQTHWQPLLFQLFLPCTNNMGFFRT